MTENQEQVVVGFGASEPVTESEQEITETEIVTEGNKAEDSETRDSESDQERTEPKPELILPDFEIRINAEDLKAWVSRLSCITDEVKIRIDENNGLLARCVDPAHVAMIQTEIKNLQCESYHVANGEIGVDLDKMLEVLKSAKKGDLIRIVTLPDIHKIEITVNGLVRTMAPIDTAGMTDPKIPNLNFPVKFDIDGKSLLAIVKQCGTVSDHVKITANLGTVIIDAEGDTDKVHAVLEVSGFEARDMPVSSMFPLDYLENFLKTVKGEILSIYLGNDYPVKATWETGVFLLAPRIESD